MRLLTLNCHSWQEDKQLDKIKYIAKVINEKNYDVIALQEVSQLIEANTAYDNVKDNNFALVLKYELNKLGNHEYDFYWDISHIGYDIYEEGLCLMTKLPIVNKETFYISKSKDINFWKTRKIVKLDIKYSDKKISFYSCHLGWWNDLDDPFKYQANNLLEKIKSDDLAFLMGDFNNNANIRDEGYDYLSESLLDTYKLAKEKDNGITVKGNIAGWDKNKDELRLDLIFTNKDIDVISSKVIFNGLNKEIVSDHYGVEIEISI